MNGKIRLIELFSGAGGFSALLEGAFRPVLALDNDPRAHQVYSRNRPEVKFVPEDITGIRDFSNLCGESPDIALAGPPCQGFSFVGMKTKKALSFQKKYDPATDPRNYLPLEISRVAVQLKPKLIIIENVPAMKTHIVSHNGDYIRITGVLREQLEDAGYIVSEPFNLNSYELGISQRRERTFIVASLDYELNAHEFDRIHQQVIKRETRKNLEQIISDLKTHPVSTARQKILTSVPDHISRTPNSDDLKIIRNLKQGENYASLIERMPEVLEGRNHKIYKTLSFKDKFYRLRWDEPSRTIVAHLQKDGNSYIHPSLNRSVSVREAARIQSFPDSFTFGIPMSPAYRLVGNAVPPLMGKFLVEVFSRITGLLNERTANTLQFAGLVS